MEFNKRLAKTKKIIENAYKDIPADKKDAADLMIDKLSFMTVNIDDLEEDIKKNGAVEIFENGSQSMRRENPAQKSLVAMINRWTSLSKALNDLLPVDVKEVIPQNYENMMEQMRGKGKTVEKR